MFLQLLFTFLCLCCLTAAEPTSIKVAMDDGGPEFKVYVNGKVWFRNGVLGVRHQDVWWSSENTDQYALQLSHADLEAGEDSIGHFMKYK